jgi:hypothetical protein
MHFGILGREKGSGKLAPPHCFSFAIPGPFCINFQPAYNFQPTRSSQAKSSRLRSSSSTQELSLRPNLINHFPLLVGLPHSPCLPLGQWMSATLSDRPRLPAIRMPDNKIQEAFTDFRAQHSVRGTCQVFHTSVLAFCASGTSVQQNIVIGMRRKGRRFVFPAERCQSEAVSSVCCNDSALSCHRPVI